MRKYEEMIYCFDDMKQTAACVLVLFAFRLFSLFYSESLCEASRGWVIAPRLSTLSFKGTLSKELTLQLLRGPDVPVFKDS